jgi:hypothetical protein
MTRGGVTVAGLVIAAVIGNAAVSALRAGRGSDGSRAGQVVANGATHTVQQQGEAVTVPAPEQTAPSEHAVATQVVSMSVAPASASPVHATSNPVAAPGVTPMPAMALKVPTGRTELRDSMYVERGGDSAVVHFDTEMGRTRRRDKFEATLRATLPLLYGVHVESMLAAIPDGGITGERDLVSDVAASGVRLPMSTGGTLELRPVTRPGRDGPLVVGYRVRVTP